MILRPWMFGSGAGTVPVEVGGTKIEELTENEIDNFLGNGRLVQRELCKVSLDERLDVLQELGMTWSARCIDGELKDVREVLRRSTGYSAENIALEMALVGQALDREALWENIDASLPGGAESAHRFVKLGRRGEVRNLPAGPAFILASGNSLIPAVIPTALSLAVGNCTLVKPSLANYDALVQVFEPLRAMAARRPAASLMAKALAIGYFAHDSPRLRHLLEKGDLGAVNFWGGEPGRTRIMAAAVTNRHHPRCFSHGPLTGFAIVSREGADEKAARGLAENMLLYEQQLCSSPTLGAFIGTRAEAVKFARDVAARLNDMGARNPVPMGGDGSFLRSSALRVMELCGSTVLRSNDPMNAWSIAVSSGTSRLDDAVTSFPGYGLHGRRRFIELVAVEDVSAAVSLMSSLPSMLAYHGADKVQTVGLSLSARERAEALAALAPLGVYRIVSLADMYRRDPAEPYDGVHLASLFSYALYQRAGGN